MDLSVIIPSRNEMFLKQTIDSVLANIEGDTEVIAILDGAWADPPIPDHPRVKLIHHKEAIGQRAATNEGARLSRAKFVMKLDAHCAVDKGFDVKLMADCEYDWTVVPRMYNLHAFDWKCVACGNRTYQGPKPAKCEKCGSGGDFEMVMVWEPRLKRMTDFARFDSEPHFQYWMDYRKRPQAQGDICDLMCHVGAGWFMHRQRYWDIGGLDEEHGSWGQMGIEVSCKAWLSGGRQVVNKKTWYAHQFRTQPGWGFPYPQSQRQVDHAREHSRKLWFKNTWDKAVYPLSWLLEKFWPVEGWNEESLLRIKRLGSSRKFSTLQTPSSSGNGMPGSELVAPGTKNLVKSLVYYTDNKPRPEITEAVRRQIDKGRNGHEVVSVSLEPVSWGKNIHLPLVRGILTMFKQILSGIEASTADIIFLCEHDVLYHPSHFEFTPPNREQFFYNQNTWKVDWETGRALFYYCNQTSGLCAYREILLDHYRKRVARVEKEGYSRNMGYEPGTHQLPRGVDMRTADKWMSKYPNIDIRHTTNLTKNRWSQDEFRNKNSCLGWTEADEVPGWGVTKGRFQEILKAI